MNLSFGFFRPSITDPTAQCPPNALIMWNLPEGLHPISSLVTLALPKRPTTTCGKVVDNFFASKNSALWHDDTVFAPLPPPLFCLWRLPFGVTAKGWGNES